MQIPLECQKHQFPYMCTYIYFLRLGFTAEKADRISLFIFGHIKEIYT